MITPPPHAPHPDAGDYRRLDELTEDRRRELLRHAEACAPCREVLTRHDPTAIFALLGVAAIPEFSLARLGRDVDAAIDAAPPAPRFGWRAVASIAASLVLAAVFGYQAVQDESIRIAATVEDVGTHLDAAGDPPPAPLPSVRPLELLELEPVFRMAPERGVELISSPGDGEVVDFALGDTQVVMIFDKALDI